MRIPVWRKRPIPIPAVQFTGFGDGGNGFELLHVIANRGVDVHGEGEDLVIKTEEGDLHGRPGDLIAFGTAGEVYPIKERIFPQVYEDNPVGEVDL